MPLRKISGRAAITAVCLTAIALATAGTVLVTKSHAKSRAQVEIPMGYAFGPAVLTPTAASTDVGNPDSAMIIAVLLPAVRNPSQLFKIQFLTGDLYISLPVEGSTTTRMPVFFEAYFRMTQAGGTQLVIVNEATRQTEFFNTSMMNLTVRLVPAVQNGSPVQPLSMNVFQNSLETISNADGSVSHLSTQHELIGLLLPAV